MKGQRDGGGWTRASIARDRARAEREERRRLEAIGAGEGDGFPAGLTPEQIGGERVPGDGWDAYEINT